MTISRARLHELLRQGAECVLDAPEKSRYLIEQELLSSYRDQEEVAPIQRIIRRESRIGIAHWATSVMSNPAARVQPVISEDIKTAIKEAVRLGATDIPLNGYRVAQQIAWRYWMKIVFGLTGHADELSALLEHSFESTNAYAEDAVIELTRYIEQQRAELAKEAPGVQKETLKRILEEQLVDPNLASQRLGYRFDKVQSVVLISTHKHQTSETQVLEEGARFGRAVGVAADLKVTLSENALLLSFSKALRVSELSGYLPTGTSVAIGKPGYGFKGFLESYRSALFVRMRLLSAGRPHAIADYFMVRMLRILGDNEETVQSFVADVLGPLIFERDELKWNLRTYMQHGCNATETAAQLGLHRNTLNRQLERIDDLLPEPIAASNRLDVSLALEILFWCNLTHSARHSV